MQGPFPTGCELSDATTRDVANENPTASGDVRHAVLKLGLWCSTCVSFSPNSDQEKFDVEEIFGYGDIVDGDLIRGCR